MRASINNKKQLLVTCLFCACLVAAVMLSCTPKKESAVVVAEEVQSVDLSAIGKATLSEYGFFTGGLKELNPAKGVVPYSINAALFSDYACKKRFIKIPTGQQASYHPDDVFTFPEGTVLIKNFYYPADFRKPEENIQLLETRLLILEKGIWKTLPYIWNKEQTEAYLEIAGKNIEIEWIHDNGERKQLSYSVPNMNQCKGCHLRGDKIMPIGPSARQLNKSIEYGSEMQNQLVHWQQLNMLDHVPAMHAIPSLTNYEDEHATVELRARAWLEINCAHCHRADGPAKTSGLHLLASITNPAVLGVGKAPIAAGKGSGGRLYSIVPGKPDESILQYRIESTHPGIMMPELGRKLAHEEGVALIRQWITEMTVKNEEQSTKDEK